MRFAAPVSAGISIVQHASGGSTLTADVQTPTSEAATQSFEADVSRLLQLMVHSVYSDREIFVRELVSNAADACEKLRYEAIAKPELIEDGAPFAIEIAINPDAKTLTFSDNGVGMTREDLTQGLGTIARSGTKAFLDKLAAEDASKEAAAAHRPVRHRLLLVLHGRRRCRRRDAPRRGGEAWRWSSDGKGAFTIAPLAARKCAEARHARHPSSQRRLAGIPPAADARAHRARPFRRGRRADRPHREAGAEKRRIADGAAIWAKPKSEMTAEDYTEFYRGLAGQFDEPALTLHWRAEGRHEYTVLAFIPGSRPFDLFDPARKGRNKLYVRRVLITEDADLLPGWLRFVRLVVDCADLPLNVSRELIQKSDVFAAIRKGVTNRIVQELGKLAEAEPEKFAKVWENFGSVLKEGLYEDPERRDGIFKFARFTTTANPAGDRTLAQYVASLRENQTAIYYLTGDDAKRLATSPQLEGFKARGVEVLLLSDPVDAFWVSTAVGFDGKPFKSVSQGAADIKSIALVEGASAPPEASGEVATLFAFFKQTLGDEVAEVRASDRLTDSVACLIAPEFGPDRQLEKMLAAHGRIAERAKPILEVNPTHPLTLALAGRFKEGKDKSLIEDAAWLVLDEARLMEGATSRTPRPSARG